MQKTNKENHHVLFQVEDQAVYIHKILNMV